MAENDNEKIEDAPRASNAQREQFIEVKHPDAEGTGTVPVGALEQWEKLGWRATNKADLPEDHELPPRSEQLSAADRRKLAEPAETAQGSSNKDSNTAPSDQEN